MTEMSLAVDNLSISGDGYHLPWDESAAGLESLFRCKFNAAAAWYFHADNGHTLNIIVGDNLGQFFAVVHAVQFRTANKGDTVSDEFLVEISVGVSSTVRCNEQVGTVEIRCIYWSQLDLYRPVGKLRRLNRRFSGCGIRLSAERF